MIEILILFFTVIGIIQGSYSCAQTNGTFKNDDDFRSYYVCTNYCDRLEYCTKTTEYYSSLERICKTDGFLWIPAYSLTGVQEVTPNVQYRHFQQSNYDLYWSSETKNHQFTFTGRYINETQVVGTEIILSLKNKCILVRDVQLTVKGTKSFCTTNIENRYSMKCELPPNYAFSGCINY
ncbi:unnamed protein product [Adineta steineri]|uniref:Uncharacterized protein n=2 Tax=Adineta steineri TaxID=433720 RepID=A0A815RQ66_9BILA|nr:unnamed protein product [Adineta steineri]